MSRHLLCRDTFSMYGLIYHANVHLMRGHLLNADSGQDIWFSVPAKADSSNYFRDFFLEIFYFQNGDGQTVRCVVGETMLYRGFGFSATGGNTKWTCLNLLGITLAILKKQVNDVNKRVSTYLFDAATNIKH